MKSFFQIVLPRLLAIVLIYYGLTSKYSLYFLLASGIVLGAYYGWFNDMIWRPNGKLEKSIPYRAHQVWIHIIAATAGSVAFYLLLGSIDLTNPIETSDSLGWQHFILFIIAILGYTGLLPRILWFFTYAQQNFK